MTEHKPIQPSQLLFLQVGQVAAGVAALKPLVRIGTAAGALLAIRVSACGPSPPPGGFLGGAGSGQEARHHSRSSFSAASQVLIWLGLLASIVAGNALTCMGFVNVTRASVHRQPVWHGSQGVCHQLQASRGACAPDPGTQLLCMRRCAAVAAAAAAAAAGAVEACT